MDIQIPEPTNEIIEMVRRENEEWLLGPGKFWRKRERELSVEAMKAVNNIAELSNIRPVKILTDLNLAHNLYFSA